MKKTWKWKLAQRTELKWWMLYLNRKEPSQYLEWKENYWKYLWNLFVDDLTLNENSKILDVGCGPAGMFMITEKYKTVAVDPLLNQYEENLPHFNSALYPHVNFVSVPFEEFISDEKFDVVFCLNAINHFNEFENSFAKLCSLVKPNGIIILTIDAHNFSFFKYLFRIVPGDILHPHQYNLLEYISFLEKRNFSCAKQIILKREFIFNHYLLIFQPSSIK